MPTLKCCSYCGATTEELKDRDVDFSILTEADFYGSFVPLVSGDLLCHECKEVLDDEFAPPTDLDDIANQNMEIERILSNI